MSKTSAQQDKEAAAASTQQAAPSGAAAMPAQGASDPSAGRDSGKEAGPSTNRAPATTTSGEQALAGSSSQANGPATAGGAHAPPAATPSGAAPAQADAAAPSNTGNQAGDKPQQLPQRDRFNKDKQPPASKHTSQRGAATKVNAAPAGSKRPTNTQTRRQPQLREVEFMASQKNGRTVLDNTNATTSITLSASASKESSGVDYNTLKPQLQAATQKQLMQLITTEVPAHLRAGAEKVQIQVLWRAGAPSEGATARDQGRYVCHVTAPKALGEAIEAALTKPGADGTLAVPLPDRGLAHLALHHGANQDARTAYYLVRMDTQHEMQTAAAAAMLEDLCTPHPGGVHFRGARWVATAQPIEGRLLLTNVTRVDTREVVATSISAPAWAASYIRPGEHVALVTGGIGMLHHNLKGPVKYNLSEVNTLAISSLHTNPKIKVTLRKVTNHIPRAMEGTLQRTPGLPAWSPGSAATTANVSSDANAGGSTEGANEANADTTSPTQPLAVPSGTTQVTAPEEDREVSQEDATMAEAGDTEAHAAATTTVEAIIAAVMAQVASDAAPAPAAAEAAAPAADAATGAAAAAGRPSETEVVPGSAPAASAAAWATGATPAEAAPGETGATTEPQPQQPGRGAAATPPRPSVRPAAATSKGEKRLSVSALTSIGAVGRRPGGSTLETPTSPTRSSRSQDSAQCPGGQVSPNSSGEDADGGGWSDPIATRKTKRDNISPNVSPGMEAPTKALRGVTDVSRVRNLGNTFAVLAEETSETMEEEDEEEGAEPILAMPPAGSAQGQGPGRGTGNGGRGRQRNGRGKQAAATNAAVSNRSTDGASAAPGAH